MSPDLTCILVTGGYGFIGSEFVRRLIKSGYKTIVVDKLTYAGELKRLEDVKGKYTFHKADICNKTQIESIFRKERPQILVNFAAATHVDRSIQDATVFLETNINGIKVLLEASRKYKIEKFVHISTDEVYGDTEKGSFSENSPLNPSSPYSASKAAGDLLIKSYMRTYEFPAIVVRPSNNYGPWQYPEKLIPLAILKILRNERIPIYADGRNVREWLYVEDCAEGTFQILNKGKLGEIYNLGSEEEIQNIEVVKTILNIFNLSPNMIQFIKDRPGHDLRYRLNCQKLFNETGFRPRMKFEDGIKLTVHWCIKHKEWLLSKWRNIAKLYNI